MPTMIGLQTASCRYLQDKDFAIESAFLQYKNTLLGIYSFRMILFPADNRSLQGKVNKLQRLRRLSYCCTFLLGKNETLMLGNNIPQADIGLFLASDL
jgi:hypothetical protein